MKQTWPECNNNEERAEFLGLYLKTNEKAGLCNVGHRDTKYLVQSIPTSNPTLTCNIIRTFLQGFNQCLEVQRLTESLAK